MKKFFRKHDARRALIWVASMGLACAIALCGFNAGAVLGSAPQALAEANEQAAMMPVNDPSPAIYVYQRNTNSVVGVITNTREWNRSTGAVDEQARSEGSGVVIQEGGYVLTNYHVIEGGNSYQILMPSGEKATAFVVGSDSSLDLAVLQVEEQYRDQLIPVEIGSSSNLVVGSTVIAIGNPGGEILANTVTQGVVSALERSEISDKSSNTTRNVNYIQHDAAINNGNSGGGLFNYMGQLVGINTLKYAGSVYSNVSTEGLGFAIPIDTAYPIAQQLIEHGKVIRPQMGVTVSDQDGPDEPLSNTPPASACIRSITAGGPAEKAGLQQFDFIYAVNDTRVTSFRELTSELDQFKAGDTVNITVVRYEQAYIQPYNSYNYGNMFGNFFGGYGGYGYNPYYGNNGDSSSNQQTTDNVNGVLVVGGNYRFVTVSVTLELPEETDD